MALRFNFPGPPTRPDLRRRAEDAAALAVWTAWGRGASPHTLAARASALSSFGAHAWRSPTEITAIRRVLDTIEASPETLRTLALAWHEHEQARGLAPATLAQRWAILSALLTAIAKHSRKPAASIGPRPRTPRRSLDDNGVAELVRDLLRRGRPRDAAIVGLLGEVGLTDEQTLALRVRDAAALVVSDDLRAALALAVIGGRPQDAAIRARRRRSMSVAALYQILGHEGVSVAALRRAASTGRDTARRPV